MKIELKDDQDKYQILQSNEKSPMITLAWIIEKKSQNAKQIPRKIIMENSIFRGKILFRFYLDNIVRWGCDHQNMQ